MLILDIFGIFVGSIWRISNERKIRGTEHCTNCFDTELFILNNWTAKQNINNDIEF